MAAPVKKSALFVCLGNICRSPISEAVFAHLVNERGVTDQWIIDSAATGSWHTGSPPDSRAIECMEKHGIPMNHKARQLCVEDFNKFQYIFGMDKENIKNIKGMAPKSYSAKIDLLGQYDPQEVKELIVRDPYFDASDKGFEEIYEQCLRCCRGFLDFAMKQD